MMREGTVQGLRRYYLFAVCQSRLSEERGDRILQRVRTHKLPYMAQRPTLQRGYPNDEGFPEIQQRCHLHRVWFLVTHTDLSYIQAKDRYVAKSMAQAVCSGLRVFLFVTFKSKSSQNRVAFIGMQLYFYRKVTHNIGKLHLFLVKKSYFCSTYNLYHHRVYNNLIQSNR